MEEVEYGGDSQPPSIRAHHIKKRSLKNKALSVAFDEKDLKDYVTGFHKRKKKRRKEANQKIAEAYRRKRIEARKKRKLEREAVYGGTQPDPSVVPEGTDEDVDDDDEAVPVASVSGTTTYDNGDLKVMVTTREISREEEDAGERPRQETALMDGGSEKEKHKIPASQKVQFKKKAVKAVKKRSGPKQQKKRDKRKAKVQNKKR